MAISGTRRESRSSHYYEYWRCNFVHCIPHSGGWRLQFRLADASIKSPPLAGGAKSLPLAGGALRTQAYCRGTKRAAYSRSSKRAAHSRSLLQRTAQALTKLFFKRKVYRGLPCCSAVEALESEGAAIAALRGRAQRLCCHEREVLEDFLHTRF